MRITLFAIVHAFFVGVVINFLFATPGGYAAGLLLGSLGYSTDVVDSAAYLYTILILDILVISAATVFSARFFGRYIPADKQKTFAIIAQPFFFVAQALLWYTSQFPAVSLFAVVVASALFFHFTLAHAQARPRILAKTVS